MSHAKDDGAPVASYGDFDEGRTKHLELVQAVIARLAGNGFLMKGWAVTVAGVFFGFAVNVERWQLAVASALPTVMFWGLDAYFLRAERLFRELYRRVAIGDPGVAPFFMGATGRSFRQCADADTANYWRTFLRRPVLVVFYVGLLLAAGAVAVVIAVDGASRSC